MTRKWAIAANPAVNEPISSFSQPMMAGPKNPPMVPMELMSARPPAAAAPVKKRDGIAQNIARAALRPASATVMPRIDGRNDYENSAKPNPAVDNPHVSATCKMRQPRRSIQEAQSTMPTIASEKAVCLMISGNQTWTP